MELGKALAIAAAKWDVPSTGAIADDADRPLEMPILDVSAEMRKTVDCDRANLAVLHATRAMLARVIAMLA